MVFFQTKQKLMPHTLAFRLFVILILLFLCRVPLWTQIHITGRVQTIDSLNVQNAIVLLRSQKDSAALFRTTTDSEGRFSFVLNGVGAPKPVPSGMHVFQNYPNPFTDKTTISYDLATASTVEISVCDVLGRQVWRQVVDKSSDGLHSVVWDGLNQGGSFVAPGVYFCTVKSTEAQQTIKVLYGFAGDVGSIYEPSRMMLRSLNSPGRDENELPALNAFIDVIDTTASLPRFETRCCIEISFERDTSIMIRVHEKATGKWEFVSYKNVQRPLKLNGDYLYAFDENGIVRRNIRKREDNWETFFEKDIVGSSWSPSYFKLDHLSKGKNNDTLFISTYAGKTPNHRMFRSTNNGGDWHANDSTLAYNYLGVTYYHQIHALLSSSSYTIGAGDANLLRSSDSGNHWEDMYSEYYSRHSRWVGVLEHSHTNESIICVGGSHTPSDEIWLLLSKDAGVTWSTIDDSLYATNRPGRWSNSFRGVAFDCSDSIIYLATSEDAQITTNYGRTWKQVYPASIAEIFCDPALSGHVYLFAIDSGFIESFDFGIKWRQITYPSGLREYSLTNFAYDEIGQAMYIGSKNGLWKYKL